MENYDIVDSYHQCVRARDYYREVAKPIDTLLQLSRNTDRKKHNDSLALSQTFLSDRSFKLLNNRDSNGYIPLFEHEQVLRWRANHISADKAREDESIALRGIMSILEATRKYLLYNMSTRQVVKLIKEISLTALQDVRESLKLDIGNLQYRWKLLEEERVKKGTVTKDEMAAEIIDILGVDDEEVNKITPSLGEALKEQSVQEIEFAWNAHLGRLESLSKSLVIISKRLEHLITIEKVVRVTMTICGNKHGNLFQVNLHCSKKQSASVSALLLTGDGGHDIQELEAASDEVVHDAAQTSAEGAVESSSSESTSTVNDEPEAGVVNTDAVEDSDSTQITSVETKLIDQGSESPIQAPMFLPEVTLEEYERYLDSSSTNACNIPTPSSSICEGDVKDYDFNQENQSRPHSTSAAAKESYINAFAGIDTYARDLFGARASARELHHEVIHSAKDWKEVMRKERAIAFGRQTTS